MLSYEAIFFDDDMVDLIHSLENDKLVKVINNIHCTFKYHPAEDEIFNDIVGKTFEIYIVGYGNDGQNSGFKVLLPEELNKYYINYHEENPSILKVPHITTSLAEGAIPMNTKNLNFEPLETPIKLIGKFGFYIKGEDGEYVSYEPFLENIKK